MMELNSKLTKKLKEQGKLIEIGLSWNERFKDNKEAGITFQKTEEYMNWCKKMISVGDGIIKAADEEEKELGI